MTQITAQSLLDAATHTAIFSTDCHGKIMSFNVGAENLLGYNAAEIIGKNKVLSFYDPRELQAYTELFNRCTDSQLEGFSVLVETAKTHQHEHQQWTYITNQDQRLQMHVTTTPIYGNQGDVNGILFIAIPMKAKENDNARESHLRYESLKDLPNRIQSQQLLDIEMRRMRREKKPLSLLKISIDSFDEYQKTYKEEEIKDTLNKVAFVLGHRIRRAGDISAYYGNQHFMVILSNTDKDGTAKVAEQLRLLVSELRIEHVTSTVEPCLTVSIGIYHKIPTHGDSAMTWIAKCREAIGEAQKTGGNRSLFIEMP